MRSVCNPGLWYDNTRAAREAELKAQHAEQQRLQVLPEGVRNGRLRVPNMDRLTVILMRYIVPQVDSVDTLVKICIDGRTADSSSTMFQ